MPLCVCAQGLLYHPLHVQVRRCTEESRSLVYDVCSLEPEPVTLVLLGPCSTSAAMAALNTLLFSQALSAGPTYPQLSLLIHSAPCQTPPTTCDHHPSANRPAISSVPRHGPTRGHCHRPPAHLPTCPHHRACSHQPLHQTEGTTEDFQEEMESYTDMNTHTHSHTLSL